MTSCRCILFSAEKYIGMLWINFIYIATAFLIVSSFFICIKQTGKFEKKTGMKTPSEDDNNLNGMEYKLFFAALYEADNVHLKIYAYDFVDNKTAKRYFKSCAKRESIGNRDCCVYTDTKKCIVTALDSTKAYSFYTEPKCKKAVDDYLRCAFSIEIKSVR